MIKRHILMRIVNYMRSRKWRSVGVVKPACLRTAWARACLAFLDLLGFEEVTAAARAAAAASFDGVLACT